MAILAITGIVLVASHIRTADARALDNQEPREVYLVTGPVVAGTPVEEIEDSLKLQTVPAVTVPDDAVASLTDFTGKVAGVDLMPGEQLLASRLVDPQALEAPGVVPVPKGMQEVTIQLDPARTVGGQLAAGDTVGVFVSFDEEPQRTSMELHKVLITSMQGAAAAEAPAEGEEASAADTPAVPEGSMLVTLAVKADTAEEIVFAAEFGSIWLSHEPENAEENDNGARMGDFE